MEKRRVLKRGGPYQMTKISAGGCEGSRIMLRAITESGTSVDCVATRFVAGLL